MATFKITANSTVKSFSKAFKEEFGATLQIYDGRLKADDSIKLIDIGVKTGTFECRANRTVGSFVKMMQDEFNMKVKVRTADDWVTVIDGLTLNRINDLPKQPTKTMMEDFVSYQRKDTKPEEQAETKRKVDNMENIKEQLPNQNAIYFVINSEPREIVDEDDECGEDWFIAYRAIKDCDYVYGVYRYDPHDLADELGVDIEDIEIYDMGYNYGSHEDFPSNKNIYLPEWLYELYTTPNSNILELCPDEDSEPIRAAINCCLTDQISDWTLDREVPCILIKKDDKKESLAVWFANN